MAMGMLGNSVRCLQPKERRLLYRSCVVPIATYGFHLWFYNKAFAVVRATQVPGCTRIVIFTDHIASAKKALDPSVHSGQGHSLVSDEVATEA
ncbi:hypothetical protein HYPSUDRAFT_210134 [Hypholoma sublateritium FD-334 SS-4]|uniref:Uncharacterized protein n=1 Tax=Hypholoma sublateritium (strain FD-334 SS-4) TaxID=945553 RepID=A0A0D2LPS1_HYPSF|nr:hypothetical protein HYPSUDRAFT_210134 [Hypholoma sublateritium FD-334 SS-4]